MIFNFGKRKANYEPGKLLFYYFNGQAGLPMEPGYDKVTLTATENPDRLQMDVYHRPTGDGEVVSKTTYMVSATVFDDVMKIVRKRKLTNWNKHDYPGMCGRQMVCKFIWKGEPVRVSSDNMPENGKKVFVDIQMVLYGSIDPAAISEELKKDFVATLKVSNVVQSTMEIQMDKMPKEPEKVSEPQIINVRAGSLFYGFSVTEVKEDYMRFNTDLCRYIVNNGPVETKFIIHKGETLRLSLFDILDASDLTVIELLDVKESDQ